MKTIADLKGKRVGMGYSAMRTIDPMVKAILATGGLTEKDVTPVLIPNVIRGADDFTSGRPTCSSSPSARRRCARSTPPSAASARWKFLTSGMPAAKKILPEGYLTPAQPNPFFVGVDHPMSVYTWDNMIFTNAR